MKHHNAILLTVVVRLGYLARRLLCDCFLSRSTPSTERMNSTNHAEGVCVYIYFCALPIRLLFLARHEQNNSFS